MTNEKVESTHKKSGNWMSQLRYFLDLSLNNHLAVSFNFNSFPCK